jgi:hypothetical protein
VFGGGILTATDIAVRSGIQGIGKAVNVDDIGLDLAGRAQQAVTKILEVCFDFHVLAADWEFCFLERC